MGEDLAERIAFGLYVLESRLFANHEAEWAALPDTTRDLFMARARFVLSYADKAVASRD